MIAVFILGAVTAGCSAEPGQQPEGDEFQLASTSQDLYVLSSAVWPLTKIPVCWVNPGWTTEKAWVREAVQATWSSVSKVEFTGWGDCSPLVSKPSTLDPNRIYNGIRIKISDEQPRSFIGRSYNADFLSENMWLNFSFVQWPCSGSAYECIHKIAVHEFGHALGFAHEHQRPDSTCHEAASGPNGDYTYGPYDPGSVMDYCNHLSWPLSLSEGDIWSVQALYGGKRGMIVSRLGGCLELLGGNYYTHGEVYLRKCTGVDQNWSWMYSGGSIQALGAAGAPFWMLEAGGGWTGSSSPENYDLAAGGPNSADWSQKFKPTSLEIRGHLGKCLDYEGSYIRMKPCNGGASQKWEFVSASGTTFGSGARLKASNGLCLQATDDLLGGQYLTTCSDNPLQKYSLVGGGKLQSTTGMGTRCLEPSPSAGYYDAAPVYPMTCVADSVRQNWHFNLNLTSAMWPSICLAPGNNVSMMPQTRTVGFTHCYSDEWYRFEYYR